MSEKVEITFGPGTLTACLEASVKILAGIPNHYFRGDDGKLRLRNGGRYILANRESVMRDLDERVVFRNDKGKEILPPQALIGQILKCGQTTLSEVFRPLPTAEQQVRSRTLELKALGLSVFEIADRLWHEFEWVRKESREKVVSGVEQAIRESKSAA
jgi:hypothetical protein